jgi:imidazolonepropionase-like amidohydrolase
LGFLKKEKSPLSPFLCGEIFFDSDQRSNRRSTMKRIIRLGMMGLAVAVATAVVTRADAPHIYAIKGARIVTAAGAPIPSGNIVVRRGLIEAVGADAAIPGDAIVIEGKGLTVYPGLVDMGTSTGVEMPQQAAPANLRTTAEAERFKRTQIFRPHLDAASHLQADAPELARLAAAGITTVLAMPNVGIVRGQSALVNVAGPPEEPQIGNVGDYRQGLQVVRTPVALHVNFTGGGGGRGYPNSLMGTIAFVRQSFLDAQHQRAAEERYARVRTASMTRPSHDPTLTALQPALDGQLPVAFEANAAREILRVLDMAQEFKLDPIVTGAGEADEVTAQLKARNVRVVYNLNYPTRSRALPPDADEPLRTLQTRANAPKVPAALAKAGVPFAFSSAGLRDPRDFVRNAGRAVREGLPADAAIRALTIDAARIAGADDRVGSLERGKIANLLVTEGDLFDERLQVKHVFVDGRMVDIEPPPAPAGGGRGRGAGPGR